MLVLLLFNSSFSYDCSFKLLNTTNNDNSFENNYILFARKYEDTSNTNKSKIGAYFGNTLSDWGKSDSNAYSYRFLSL